MHHPDVLSVCVCKEPRDREYVSRVDVISVMRFAPHQGQHGVMAAQLKKDAAGQLLILGLKSKRISVLQTKKKKEAAHSRHGCCFQVYLFYD